MEFIITSLVFGFVQIGIWGIFPRIVREFLFGIPFFAITMNFFGSFLILRLAGSSGFIGSCNLAGSLVFGCYVLYINERRKNGKKSGLQVSKVPPKRNMAGPVVLREKHI